MSPTRTLVRLVLAACLTMAGSSRPAHAQAAPDSVEGVQASELRRRGNEAMEAKRYGDALALYKQAYSISKDPALFYNQGRAFEALGQFSEALMQLEKFEAEAPADLKARVPGLRQKIAEIRSRVPTVSEKKNVSEAQVRPVAPRKETVAPPKETAAPVAPAPTESKSITSQWWFWTGASVLVVGGAALAAAVLIDRPADRGDIPPGQVSVSLIRF